jgi:hypothetical protein
MSFGMGHLGHWYTDINVSEDFHASAFKAVRKVLILLHSSLHGVTYQYLCENLKSHKKSRTLSSVRMVSERKKSKTFLTDFKSISCNHKGLKGDF